VAQCSKPSCNRRAAVVLAYDYRLQRATLALPDATGEKWPHLYGLCSVCADRLVPPRGWELDDRRKASPAQAVSSLPDRSTVVLADDGDSSQIVIGHGA
jgi:hypothetical protein